MCLRKGRYVARQAEDLADLTAAQKLRQRAFRPEQACGTLDEDGFDAKCLHILVEDMIESKMVCCFRLMILQGGDEIDRSYSAQFYELGVLRDFKGPMAEVGRFCIDPACFDADILRVAWGAMTRFVDENGIRMLFGCSSFAGTETRAYLDAFAMLRTHHLAPKRWLPKAKAPDVFRFARRSRRKPDVRRAMLSMPPLLRTYLMMGGWVSDHAVVDRDLNTLHVFTGLEIGAIPPAWARSLRRVAG